MRVMGIWTLSFLTRKGAVGWRSGRAAGAPELSEMETWASPGPPRA